MLVVDSQFLMQIEEETTDEIDDTVNCLVCFEKYQGSGDHVPRILPCSHTLCEKCIGTLFQVFTNTLDCPQCHVKHQGCRQGVRTFPQNKYILRHLKDKTETSPTATAARSQGIKNTPGLNFEKCKEHSRDEIFHCTEAGCKKNICPVCLLKEHKSHNVVDIVNDLKERKHTLLSELEPLLESLVDMQKKIVRKEGKLKMKYEDCKNKILESKKRELDRVAKRFDELLLKFEIKWGETKRNISADRSIIDDRIDEITNMQSAFMKEPISALPVPCIMSKIQAMSKTHVPKEIKYKFLEYREAGDNGDKLDEQCGSLIEKQARVPRHGVPDCTGTEVLFPHPMIMRDVRDIVTARIRRMAEGSIFTLSTIEGVPPSSPDRVGVPIQS